MNKITNKERTEKNNIVCPNCHINIKVLTDDLFLPMGDEWHDDMYISHEDEYLERKELQQRIDKAIDFINAWKDNKTELKVSMLDLLQIEDILRGEDNVKD